MTKGNSVINQEICHPPVLLRHSKRIICSNLGSYLEDLTTPQKQLNQPLTPLNRYHVTCHLKFRLLRLKSTWCGPWLLSCTKSCCCCCWVWLPFDPLNSAHSTLFLFESDEQLFWLLFHLYTYLLHSSPSLSLSPLSLLRRLWYQLYKTHKPAYVWCERW